MIIVSLVLAAGLGRLIYNARRRRAQHRWQQAGGKHGSRQRAEGGSDAVDYSNVYIDAHVTPIAGHSPAFAGGEGGSFDGGGASGDWGGGGGDSGGGDSGGGGDGGGGGGGGD
jgi:uncharacterized membrane protein YgcG